MMTNLILNFKKRIVCLSMCAMVLWVLCEGQRPVLGIQFSPATFWDQVVKFRLSGLLTAPLPRDGGWQEEEEKEGREREKGRMQIRSRTKSNLLSPTSNQGSTSSGFHNLSKQHITRDQMFKTISILQVAHGGQFSFKTSQLYNFAFGYSIKKIPKSCFNFCFNSISDSMNITL